MKCTKCGADVEAKKFCPYCGERLTDKKDSGIHVQRAHRIPSGVMRMRKHVSVSDTALPNVQNNPHDIVGEIAGDNSSSEFTSRKSLELEALLEKLNQNESDIDLKVTDDCESEDTLFDSEPSISEVVVDGESLFNNNSSVSSASLTDDFFNHSDEIEAHVSGPIPVGSGTFSRVPSGGFQPIVESIKSAFQNISNKVKDLFKKSDNDNVEVYQSDAMAKKERRKFIMAAVVTAITVFLVIGIILSQDKTETSTEIAAQNNVNNEDNYNTADIENDDIANLTFDGDDFVIPDLDFASDDEAQVESGIAAGQKNTKKPTAAQAEIAAKAAREAAAAKSNKNTVIGQNKVTEIRRYGKNDNVLANLTSGESVKLNKQCIMREGPASRFGLVKQIPVGTTVKILANTEEDWELQSNGVWTKAGQTAKLGPGSKFADAKPGMTVPQPKSRVISSSNWRYIQAGDLFGYVGPACFK